MSLLSRNVTAVMFCLGDCGDGGCHGVLVACDCSATVHLVVDPGGPPPSGSVEVAYTCTGCGTAHWLTYHAQLGDVPHGLTGPQERPVHLAGHGADDRGQGGVQPLAPLHGFGERARVGVPQVRPEGARRVHHVDDGHPVIDDPVLPEGDRLTAQGTGHSGHGASLHGTESDENPYPGGGHSKE